MLDIFHRVLVLVWSLCCWGALAVTENSTEPYGLRLVGGDSRCRGKLQFQRRGEEWTGVDRWRFSLEFGNRVCAELNCGSILSVDGEETKVKNFAVRLKYGFCNDTSLINCFRDGIYRSDHTLAELNCSDSVRLVGEQSLCSGSLLMWDQSVSQWTGVCEGALDHRGAEVLCRELGCGAPIVQGALSPLGQILHCEGHESALKDCPRNQTWTHPENCSPLQVTCSEPLRLVGGPTRCEGTVELKHKGDWRRMLSFTDGLDLEGASRVCGSLDCGSAVSAEDKQGYDLGEVWAVQPECVRERAARDCIFSLFQGSDFGQEVVCSGLQGVPPPTETPS